MLKLYQMPVCNFVYNSKIPLIAYKKLLLNLFKKHFLY